MLGAEQGGLGRYVEQLVIHLVGLGDDYRYVLFLRKENWDAYTPKDSRVQKVLADIPWYSLEEQVTFPTYIRRAGVHYMHFPHWNVPWFYRGPFIVTVHDLIMWHYPRVEASTHGYMAYWAKDRASRMILRRTVKAARHILTTSEWTKHDIHTSLRVPYEKMTVTYQAPFLTSVETAKSPPSVFDKYDITHPYVLYVGQAYPHKNLARLVDAWTQVHRDTDGVYQLVLVGKKNYFYDRLISDIKRRGIEGVVWTDFVDDSTLDALYNHASLVVAPSLYEGFALPALEAMARGTPVVASNRTCFPEVLGEGALYFDPESTDHIAYSLYRGLKDESLRAELRRHAALELARYSWVELAKKTRGIYQRIFF